MTRGEAHRRRREERRQQRDENLQFLDFIQTGAKRQRTPVSLTDLGFVDSHRRLAQEGEVEGEVRDLETPVPELRRGRRRRSDDPVSVVTLTDVDGVFRWEVGPGFSPVPTGRRRGRRRAAAPDGEIVDQFKFADLPPNKIGQWLRKVDDYLTPPATQGLRVVNLRSFKVGDEAEPEPNGRILLLVHGTFSHSNNVVGNFEETAHGKKFLRAAAKQYDQVLAFGHRTICVRPILNAVDLARHFQRSKAKVDVICHSRGGLVTRWWLEALDPTGLKRGKTVFVGSPLAGTSLASPYRLKQVLELLANLSKAASRAAGFASKIAPTVAPLFEGAKILMQVVAMVTKGVAKTPLIDAGVSLIPGLSGQARVGTNGEILRLRSVLDTPPTNYYAVQSNFEPKDEIWKFWRIFRRLPEHAADVAADFIFDGPNDLVVDTHSMGSLAERQNAENEDTTEIRVPSNRTLDFGTNGEVHHLNYFHAPDTIKHLHQWLEVPS